MKVTVCINDTKIVVPCGDGDLSVRQLAELAIIRYRKTAALKTLSNDWIEISSLKLARDGGILDWDDKVQHVLDDRDLLIAQNSATTSAAAATGTGLLTKSTPITAPTSPLNNNSQIRNSGAATGSSAATAAIKIVTTTTENVNSSLFNQRHNSIPSEQHYQDSLLRRGGYFESSLMNTSVRHESLDNILDNSNQDKMLNYSSSLSRDYERWPLPPFPAMSTIQSTNNTVTTATLRHLQLDGLTNDKNDDQIWDESPNDCDEEDYPRLRPDYIVKHNQLDSQLQNPTNKMPVQQPTMANNKEVLDWLANQESVGSVGSTNSTNDGGVGGIGSIGIGIGGGQLKELRSTLITGHDNEIDGDVDDDVDEDEGELKCHNRQLKIHNELNKSDRNNNRIIISSSSSSGPPNDVIPMKFSATSNLRKSDDCKTLTNSNLDILSQQLQENSIVVRLHNLRAGENLGIKIMPIYLPAHLTNEVEQNMISHHQRSISAIGVHTIIAEGRVAKERQFEKGDQIIQINDIKLIGMSYEKADALFRDSLSKSECRLRVVPCSSVLNLSLSTTSISTSAIPTTNTTSASSSSSTQQLKINPPPPPRRSPNTTLSRSPNQSQHVPVPPNKSIPSLNNPHQINAVALTTSITTAIPSATTTTATAGGAVASWTSGLGSMVHTPASSTSSVSAQQQQNQQQQQMLQQQFPPNIQPINTIHQPNIKTEVINLTKMGSGFGFSITGKEHSTPNIPSEVFVRHILKDGAAIRDGRLRPGDRLLEIDGLILDGMSQSEVICLLREKPNGSRVKLLVERDLSATAALINSNSTDDQHLEDVMLFDQLVHRKHRLNQQHHHEQQQEQQQQQQHYNMHSNKQTASSHDSLNTSLSDNFDEDATSTLSKNKVTRVLEFDIPLTNHEISYAGTSSNHEPMTLGVSVKVEPNWDSALLTQASSKTEIDRSNVVWVKTVIENGAAHRDGKLKVGDQLLKVNHQTLSGLSSDEALAKLKAIIKSAQESTVHVMVRRKLHGGRSNSLTTLNSMTGSGVSSSLMPFYDQSCLQLPPPSWPQYGLSTTSNSGLATIQSISSGGITSTSSISTITPALASSHLITTCALINTNTNSNHNNQHDPYFNNSVPNNNVYYNQPIKIRSQLDSANNSAPFVSPIHSQHYPSPPQPLPTSPPPLARRLKKNPVDQPSNSHTDNSTNQHPLPLTCLSSSASPSPLQQQSLHPIQLAQSTSSQINSSYSTTNSLSSSSPTITNSSCKPISSHFPTTLHSNFQQPYIATATSINTLCRNQYRDRCQVNNRARQVRSHCSVTPTHQEGSCSNLLRSAGIGPGPVKHLEDVDWSKMELVPFFASDNTSIAGVQASHQATTTTTSSSSTSSRQPSTGSFASHEDSKKHHHHQDHGSQKRKKFKKFSLTHLFKQSIISKPKSNSTGSSPVIGRRKSVKYSDEINNLESMQSHATPSTPFPVSKSSHSIRSCDAAEDVVEYPYADLDFDYYSTSPNYATNRECDSNNNNIPGAPIVTGLLHHLLPLAEESMKEYDIQNDRLTPTRVGSGGDNSGCIGSGQDHGHTHGRGHDLDDISKYTFGSNVYQYRYGTNPIHHVDGGDAGYDDDEDDEDDEDDLEDVQAIVNSGYVMSAVQRIAQAMPKQPVNRFVYEDAEELFQSLQANVGASGSADVANIEDDSSTLVKRDLYSSGLPLPRHLQEQQQHYIYTNTKHMPPLPPVPLLTSPPLPHNHTSSTVVKSSNTVTNPYLQMQYFTDYANIKPSQQ